MVLDSSALIAILSNPRDADHLLARLRRAATAHLPAITHQALRAALRLHCSEATVRRFDHFLLKNRNILIFPPDPEFTGHLAEALAHYAFEHDGSPRLTFLECVSLAAKDRFRSEILHDSDGLSDIVDRDGRGMKPRGETA